MKPEALLRHLQRKRDICETYNFYLKTFFYHSFLRNGACTVLESSKKMESAGLNRKLPFLNVHTTTGKKGEVSSLTYIIEMPLLTNGTLQYCCPGLVLLSKIAVKYYYKTLEKKLKGKTKRKWFTEFYCGAQ